MNTRLESALEVAEKEIKKAEIQSARASGKAYAETWERITGIAPEPHEAYSMCPYREDRSLRRAWITGFKSAVRS